MCSVLGRSYEQAGTPVALEVNKQLLTYFCIVAQWDSRVPIVGTHCCATMTWDHIRARMM
jgi:hypothetical protein